MTTAQSYASMKRQVSEEQQAAKLAADLQANMRVIRGHMADGYKKPFSVYDGGDAQYMVKRLTGLGYNAFMHGSLSPSVMVQL